MATVLLQPARPAPSAAGRQVDQRAVWLVVGLATAVAAALRFPFLGHQSLWFDEIYTRTIVGQHTLAGIWQHVRATESTPPLYYLLAKLSSDVAGARSAAAMRFPSALALTAAAPVAYLAFRRLVGRRSALVAAVIVAVNPLLVSYSTDARSYGLLVLTALLSVWGLATVLESGSQPAYLGWAAACVACAWTHYFGALTVAAEVVVLLAVRPLQRRQTLAWTAAIALSVAPLVPLLVHQNASEDAAYIAGISRSARLEQTVRQFAMGPNVPRTWLEAAGLVVSGACLAAGAAFALRRIGARIVLVLAAITVGVPLVIALAGLEDRFYARNVIVALPLAAALAAPAFLRLRAAPLIAYLALATLTSVWVATNWRYEQTDWRTAIVRARSADNAVPVIAVGSERVAATYLNRDPAVAPVRTARALLVVEPHRGAGDRAMVPAPVPAAVSAGVRGFAATQLAIVHGFRLILLSAPRTQTLAPARLGGAAILPPR